MTPPWLNSRRRLAIAATVLLAFAVWAVRPGFWRASDQHTAPPAPNRTTAVARPAFPTKHQHTTAADEHSDTDLRAAFVAHFQAKQVREELAIEQQRYGSHYWETEADGPTLRALEACRAAALARLSAEKAAAWQQLFGDAPAESMRTEPLFGPENPGPKIDFLPEQDQAAIATAIADLHARNALDAAALLGAARARLSEEHFSRYAQWNAASSRLRRQQLVGFNTTEAEFNALARWPELVNRGTDTPEARAVAQEIGAARFTDLVRLQDPERQTALHDARRLGLPLDEVADFQAARSVHREALQAIWADPNATTAAKERRVADLTREHQAHLLSLWAPPDATTLDSDLIP